MFSIEFMLIVVYNIKNNLIELIKKILWIYTLKSVAFYLHEEYNF